MLIKTTIFVNGRNLRADLYRLSVKSDNTTNEQEFLLDERDFDWKRFYDGLLVKFDDATGWEHQLSRVYWYSSANISPWIQWSNRSQHLLAKLLVARHPEISQLTTQTVISLAYQWYSKQRNDFEQYRYKVHKDIQRRTNFLEFRYMGEYRVDPFLSARLEQLADGSIDYKGNIRGDRGTDIGMAIDMVAKMAEYEVAILIGGNSNFLPVVEYIKGHNKYVYEFSLQEGVSRYPAVSDRLNGKADCFASYDEMELLENYLDRSSGIPPAILDAIDARIADQKSKLLDDQPQTP